MTKDNFWVGAVSRLRSPLRKHHSINLNNSKKASRSSDNPVIVDVRMGKSNKFDYTNRSNSGAKLGQIIGTSLLKEAEKVKKDADRHIQKARKQSTDSMQASSDNCATTHIIDLKAPNKDLGDDGVSALADGLEIALRNGTAAASLALEDLNLSGNSMTTSSLARLAPIIEHARYDLKTLNLSGNKIQVETDEQAEQWEVFLRSFKDCLRLRRLDLSSNPELGTRALEILAKVHISEPPITPMRPGGEASVLSLVSEESDETSMQSYSGTTGMDGESGGFRQNMVNGRVMKRRCGLRSIPYITLHDVGVDEAGALWLSYVVQDHYYPNQLIDELNATNAESLIKAYQQDTDSRGIDWADNKTVGKDGMYLLDKTEALRRQMMLDDRASMVSPIVGDDVGDDALVDEELVRRQSMQSTFFRAVQGNRRVSLRSIRTEDGGEHETTELESLRRKIQRHIIAHDGPRSVELWSAALKAFRGSRIMLYVAPTTRKHYTGEPRFQMPDCDVPDSVTIQPPSPADSPIAKSPPQLTVDTVKAARFASTDPASYASKLLSPTNHTTGYPESAALTEVTNTPGTPLRLQRPTHRKGAFSAGDDTDLQTVTDKLNNLMVRDSNPKRFVRYQQARVAEEERSFRDTSRACHLPTVVLQAIISLTMTERERRAVNGAQLRAAIERGQRRDTLTVEREWLKKDESAQVWMLLDSINCLAYGE